ncbi:MAG: hypothetical protein K8S18_00735, partial [Desulfobacula sp.]|nr:hypothetical protein [Desulfobacula sp.]
MMKQSAYLIGAFVFLCILSLFGCSHTVKKGYLGHELPNDKVAKILIPSNIYLQLLDGKFYHRPVLSLKTSYYIDILPDSHSITVLPLYSPQGPATVSGSGTNLDFNAESGNTYEPQFVVYNIHQGYKKVSYQTNVWIQNRTKYKNGLYY